MFEDSLLESGGRTRDASKRDDNDLLGIPIDDYRGVGAFSLLSTEALPKRELLTFLVAPTPRLRRPRLSQRSSTK